MSRRAPTTGVVALLLGALLLTGCSSDPGDPAKPAVPAPGEPSTAVDTPELRAAKAAAGIEDCVPGTATSSGLPDVTLPCLGGGPDVDVASLQGPLVLNFWYAACGPCRREMPVLGEFHRRYGAQVPIVGIDTNDTVPQQAIELAGERRATYPQLADTGGALLATPQFARIGTTGLPATVVVDADGEVRDVVAGGVESVEDLVALVDGALGTDLAGRA